MMYGPQPQPALSRECKDLVKQALHRAMAKVSAPRNDDMGPERPKLPEPPSTETVKPPKSSQVFKQQSFQFKSQTPPGTQSGALTPKRNT